MRTAVQTIGDYELLDLIAEGGMGAVYRARQRSTGQTVALKLAPPQLDGNTVLMKRFQQEYNAASSLNHPNVVRALDFGYHGSSPFLVMEYVEGESLGQRLEREGRLSEAEALRIMTQVAQGLQRAHKNGLVHRDVKPDNILLMPDGQVKLADLGLVKELDADLNLTRTGRGLGTPHFMAPEQFRDAKNADARCDIYSMAATLYMMVTGELPFKSLGPVETWMKKLENKLPPVRQLVPGLSERLSWAIERAMSADREQRPGSCRELIEDLTGHSTRRLTPVSGTALQDLWYVMYHDEEGVLHSLRGNTVTIRRSLKDRDLSDAADVRASRTKTGPFEPLHKHPEFRDLVLGPAVSSSTPAPRPRPSPATPLPPARAALASPSPPLADTAPVPPVRAQTPVPLGEPPALHIDLGRGEGPAEWLKWLLFLLITVGAGVAGFFLLPRLP
jgi:serine/threonine protein kinase